jgi:Protein of unknown function (DUF3577)
MTQATNTAVSTSGSTTGFSTAPSLSTASLPKYFDLHTSGIGYLQRIRVVTPKRGGSFLACSVSAIRGNADDVEYTNFDLRVSGALAQEAIVLLESMVQPDTKILIGFKVGDIYPDSFEVKGGENAGQLRLLIKGRLLQVTFAKVNGKDIELPQFVTEAKDEAVTA